MSDAAALPDPYADQPKKWVGRVCRFDHAGARLVGTVTAQKYAGRTPRGALPDYTLTVRGQSGKTLEISLVESRASFD
jgi:hypothetical protein